MGEEVWVWLRVLMFTLEGEKKEDQKVPRREGMGGLTVLLFTL